MKLNAGPPSTRGSLLRQVPGEDPHEQAVRILSIDGGGVRGLLPAMVLAEIEARTGRHLTQLFDIVAGTSTGSVLGLGLAVPGPEAGVPRWGAGDGVELYRRHLPEVFERSRWQAMAGMGNLLREKYDEQPLERTLQRYFGECRLSEALTNVVVPAFDLVSGRVLLFDSEVARTDTTLDLPMRLVVRGATAAPTYFEPELIGPPFVIEDHLLVDGGIFANNPGMCAFMQAQRRHRGADVVMVSLGTGSVARSLRHEEVRSWGVAHWARPLLNLVLASASQAADLQLRSLLGDRRYFRFEADLDLFGCSHRLDDASEGNLMALEKAGRGMITAQSEEIDLVCQLLAP